MTGLRFTFLAIAVGVAAGCTKPDPNRIQGYVEGEFVYVASPLRRDARDTRRRARRQVKAGDLLFALEPEPETAARDEAIRRVAQARANLEDAKKGQRPTEIESLEAQLQQAPRGARRERRANWSAPNASSTWAPGPRKMSTAPAPPATRT